MHADAFFRIGSTHRVCQDYAVAGTHEGRPYAMVSDGCSSSPDTDFGARFLVRAAQRRIAELTAGHFDATAIATDAMSMVRQADIDRHALDATLLCASFNGERAHVIQTGDGVVAARRRDGSFVYYETSFDQGAPYYLSYLLNNADWATYRRMVGWKTFTTREHKPRDGWTDPTHGTIAIDEMRPVQTFGFGAEEFDVVLLLSDGCQSFFDGASAVGLEPVIEQVFALKNLAGEFITRRCGAFLQRFCQERGWKHGDDFSVAGIYLGAAP